MYQHYQNKINNLSKPDIDIMSGLAGLEFRGVYGRDYDYVSKISKFRKEKGLFFKYDGDVEYDGLKEKIKEFCTLFEATSFQEVIRKLLYYELINIKVSKEYLKYLDKFSAQRYCAVSKFRNEVLKLVLSLPCEFADFCFEWEEGREDVLCKFVFLMKRKKLNNFINKTSRLFSYYRLNYGKDFIDFFNIFNISDEDKKRSKKLKKILGVNYEYLYIVQKYIERFFPIIINKQLNKKEEEIVDYLINEGDEISYFKNRYKNKKKKSAEIEKICKAYNCSSTNEMINLAIIVKNLNKRI